MSLLNTGAHKGYWDDQKNRKDIYKYLLRKITQYVVVYFSRITKTEGR